MISEKNILKQLKKVVDPELGVNIVDLGLIYGVKAYSSSEAKQSREVQKENSSRQARTINYYNVEIDMTLTSPGCPFSFVFEEWVREAVLKIKGVKKVFINLVFEPLWNPDKMSEEAKEKIGIFS